MNVTEQSISNEMQNNIQCCARDAAQLLGVDAKVATPGALVEAVDQFVHKWQQGERPENAGEGDEDYSLTLGSLWGEQLVKELGWQWAKVTFHDHEESTAIGVFSADRSLAIYPFHFVYGCIEKEAPVTILLAFNILTDGKRVPELPAGGYENVMDNVHHSVPRD